MLGGSPMFNRLKVTPEAIDAIKNFSAPQGELAFGKVMCPVMIVSDFDNGEWGPLEMLPYGPISLDPTTKVLHYGQEIFEGMKGYRTGGKGPFLFRPDQNFERFNFSARRMGMPEVPEDLFMDAVKGMTSYCADFIPKRSGESLYIRPFMFATEEHLGIKPAGKMKFMVIASPSGAYISADYVKVKIEKNYTRACPGGTGNAKTGGNYAGSLVAAVEAGKQGFHQTLWLDGLHKKYIEELSGMNFFAFVDNKLYTPALTDTILNGITRSSIMTLAKDLGKTVVEEQMDINWLLEKINDGSCTEAFMCGTASIVVPIAEFGDDKGNKWVLPNNNGPVAFSIKETLLGLQEGRLEDKYGWVIPVEVTH
jgi:branched-chain amino acid aminotransferase